MVSRPSCTAVSRSGSMVSSPGKPGGGLSEFFSARVCGAGKQSFKIGMKVTASLHDFRETVLKVQAFWIEASSKNNRTGEKKSQTVICGKAVDDVHVVPERLPVVCGDEAGSHLAASGADARQVSRRQEEMMRRHLTRHRPTPLLSRANHQDLQHTNNCHWAMSWR